MLDTDGEIRIVRRNVPKASNSVARIDPEHFLMPRDRVGTELDEQSMGDTRGSGIIQRQEPIVFARGAPLLDGEDHQKVDAQRCFERSEIYVIGRNTINRMQSWQRIKIDRRFNAPDLESISHQGVGKPVNGIYEAVR